MATKRGVSFERVLEELAAMGGRPARVTLTVDFAVEYDEHDMLRIDELMEASKAQSGIHDFARGRTWAGDGPEPLDAQGGSKTVSGMYQGEHVMMTATEVAAAEAAIARDIPIWDGKEEGVEDADYPVAPEDAFSRETSQDATDEPEGASDAGVLPDVVPFEPLDGEGDEDPAIYETLIPPADALRKARDVVMAMDRGETVLKKAGIEWVLLNDGGSLRISVDGDELPSGSNVDAHVAEAHRRIAEG